MKIKENEAAIRKFYVTKEHRGMGIAQALYEKLLNFAKENNIQKLEVSTYAKLVSAVKFYTKVGFVENKTEQEEEKFFSMNLAD